MAAGGFGEIFEAERVDEPAGTDRIQVHSHRPLHAPDEACQDDCEDTPSRKVSSDSLEELNSCPTAVNETSDRETDEETGVYALEMEANDIPKAFNTALKQFSEHLSNYLASGSPLTEDSLQLLYEFKTLWSASVFADVAADVSFEDMSILYKFMDKVFNLSSDGVNALDGNACLEIHNFILSMSDKPDVSIQLLKNDFLYQHLHELSCLDNSTCDEFSTELVLANLGILYNCSQNVGIYHYSSQFNFAALFCSYVRASDQSVRMFSKLLLSYLFDKLPETCEDLLYLGVEDAQALLDGFISAASDHQASILGYTFSAVELTKALRNLVTCYSNLHLVVKSNFLPALNMLITSDSVDEQVACCEFIWKLLKSPTFKDQISLDGNLCAALLHLCDSSDNGLRLIASCLKIFMKDITLKDLATALVYAEGCYMFGQYSECIKVENFIHKQPLPNSDMVLDCMLFLGKAQFQIYKRKKSQLQQLERTQPNKELWQKNRECYGVAKKAIQILGKVYEEKHIDESGSQMLDLAMIDFASETNNLVDISRCLLCRKKAKLCRSHFFPRGLLKNFVSGVPVPSSLKVLDFLAAKSRQLKSPNELTVFLFCSSCEEILSKNGEMQFQSEFFNKVYSTSDSASPTKAQSIAYGKWLYLFCLGLVLRGLTWVHETSYYNDDEIYKLFSHCRECLLGAGSQLEKPAISVIINPTVSNAAGKQYGFMNSALNELLLYVLGESPIGNDCCSHLRHAHFFLVHFGVFNILAHLDPAEQKSLHQESIIQAGGGVFNIPCDSDRYEKVPKGLWRVFRERAAAYEEMHITDKLSVDEKMSKKNYVFPQDNVMETFRLMNSAEKDLLSFSGVSASVLPEDSKELNFLPKQFLVSPRHDPLPIVLPKGHNIVLHHTFSDNKQEGETIFLAVGSDDAYSVDRPYVIYHLSHPGIKVSCGFLISATTLKAESFLPGTVGQPTTVAVVSKVMSNIQSVLPRILNAKGISTFSSLLYRLKRRNINTHKYDTKCLEWCWYCNHLCSYCMQPSSFGYSLKGPDDRTYNFCSDTCKQKGPGSTLPPVSRVTETVVDGPDLSSYTCSISNKHTELLCVHIEMPVSEEGLCTMETTVCIGDGSEGCPPNKFYVVYYYKGLLEQLLLEFFLSDDLKPEKPLPFAPFTTEFQKLQQSNIDETFKKVLKKKNCDSFYALLNLRKP